MLCYYILFSLRLLSLRVFVCGCVCMVVCTCMHVRVGARTFGFYNCPHHIFRGDDKHREMNCLSERATNYCLVFLLVQKSFKNTNDCIFMVVTLLHAGLLCVLQKWFLWRPQGSSSQFGWKTDGSTEFVVLLRNKLLLDHDFSPETHGLILFHSLLSHYIRTQLVPIMIKLYKTANKMQQQGSQRTSKPTTKDNQNFFVDSY